MSEAISKTLSLLLLILVGYFLQKRVVSKDQRSGIKEIILSLALPAMIFISLQQVVFQWEMMAMPLMVLGFNVAMFYLTDLMMPVLGIKTGSASYRTLKMLVPSLAPGLSCFPFLLEYIGEEALANAALADLGNKVFVLIILYMISIRWFYKLFEIRENGSKAKLKNILRALINEPVNFVIVIGVLMLAFGINYQVIPSFMRMSIERLSLIMTPLILLFIGMSVRLDWDQIKTIISVLFLKSAIAYIFSGIVVYALGISNPAMIMLIVLFPQSSFSFWPFAHISAIHKLEQSHEGSEHRKTFDLDLGINVLAVSLPFSTILILTMCTFTEQVVTNPSVVFFLALIFLVAALFGPYIRYVQRGMVLKTED